LSRDESYVRTDGQSAGLSWKKAPIWGLRSDFYYCHTVAGLLMWGASLTRRRVCRLQLLLTLASAVILGPESRGTRDHILLSQIRDFPFCVLLRLAGQRWGYSTPPPHGYSRINYLFPFNNSGLTEQKSSPRNISSIIRCLSAATKRVSISQQRFDFDKRIRCLAMDYSGFQASCHNIYTYMYVRVCADFEEYLNHTLSLCSTNFF
jgi:hypothetical protein